MNKILRNALAATALVVSTPSLAASVWPDVDFEWYANVGQRGSAEAYPAPRAGYIWAPGYNEWTGTHHVAVAGVWISDDYDHQWRAHARGDTTLYSTGPLELRDRDGNVIPLAADYYPVGSTTR